MAVVYRLSLLLLRKHDKLVYAVGHICISELHQVCYLSFSKQVWLKNRSHTLKSRTGNGLSLVQNPGNKIQYQ